MTQYFTAPFFDDIKRFTPHYIIIGGDVNFPLDPSVDKIGSVRKTHQQSRECLLANVDTLNLIDVWRILHPDKFEFTWKRLNPKAVYVRLDYFFISSSLLQMVNSCGIIPGPQSDHMIVMLNFSFHSVKRGPGYWKMNTSLLRDMDYVQKMQKLIDIELANDYLSKKLTFEMLKLAVRGSTIQYSSRKKKSKENVLLALQRKLKQKELSLVNLPDHMKQSEEQKIYLIQRDINAILAEKSKGAVIRSRSRYEFCADRPSKYFLNLEKKNYCSKTIYRLQREDGQIIEGSKEIHLALKEYYQKLYTSAGTIDESYVNDIKTPKISKQMYDLFESKITLDELTNAVNALPNGKTPSTDGLPIEFYKTFWDKLKYFMLDLYNEVIDTGQFYLSARQGILSLLEKPGKNMMQLKSWRPLTLLNSCYKIFSKVLATRLQVALQAIIDPTQTGFLKGRYLAEKIAL